MIQCMAQFILFCMKYVLGDRSYQVSTVSTQGLTVNLRFCIYNRGTESSVPIGTQMVAFWVINTTHLGLGDGPQCQRHYQVCAEWQVISTSLIDLGTE